MKREINTAARWLVIAVSVAGILAAAATCIETTLAIRDSRIAPPAKRMIA